MTTPTGAACLAINDVGNDCTLGLPRRRVEGGEVWWINPKVPFYGLLLQIMPSPMT